MAVNENGLLGRRKDDGGEERIKKKNCHRKLPLEATNGGWDSEGCRRGNKRNKSSVDWIDCYHMDKINPSINKISSHWTT